MTVRPISPIDPIDRPLDLIALNDTLAAASRGLIEPMRAISTWVPSCPSSIAALFEPIAAGLRNFAPLADALASAARGLPMPYAPTVDLGLLDCSRRFARWPLHRTGCRTT